MVSNGNGNRNFIEPPLLSWLQKDCNVMLDSELEVTKTAQLFLKTSENKNYLKCEISLKNVTGGTLSKFSVNYSGDPSNFFCVKTKSRYKIYDEAESCV